MNYCVEFAKYSIVKKDIPKNVNEYGITDLEIMELLASKPDLFHLLERKICIYKEEDKAYKRYHDAKPIVIDRVETITIEVVFRYGKEENETITGDELLAMTSTGTRPYWFKSSDLCNMYEDGTIINVDGTIIKGSKGLYCRRTREQRVYIVKYDEAIIDMFISYVDGKEERGIKAAIKTIEDVAEENELPMYDFTIEIYDAKFV